MDTENLAVMTVNAGRVVLFATCLLACDGTFTQPPKKPSAKQALYGDAGLVPTREGEWARKEIAAAGAVERAVRATGSFRNVEVNVELEPTTTRVLVAGQVTAQAHQVREQVVSIVLAVLGPIGDDAIDIVTTNVPPTEPDSRRFTMSPFFALALLGLGVSIGVTLERIRTRYRAHIRRPTRPT